MNHSLLRWGTAIVMALSLFGCGGGSGGSSDSGVGSVTPAPTTTVRDAIAAAGALPTNDTSTNTLAPFSVVQQAGVPAVLVNGAPKVSFAVFSGGKLRSDLTIANVSLAIAKLVPATNGADSDQWVNYISKVETATPTVGPSGKAVLATARQATTDGKMSAAELAAANLTAQLVYNADGYYTYTFRTNITDPAQTSGVVFEPGRTHRVAIQLSYTNEAGEKVLVNPYFDFTVDANGKSVAVTDPLKTRRVTDVSSCNGCHEKLALHGGGRVDTQYCVMCHNMGTTDANSGNNLNLSTMVHKLHAGKLLKAALDAGKGGEDYTIWGYQNSKVSFADVGFPQDLRNCTKCHTGANPNTPQGDNWKSRPNKEACLTCHASGAGSDWATSHTPIAANLLGAGTPALSLTNTLCAGCHRAGSNISAERVHWNQNEENAAKYKMNIESVTFDATSRKATVKYFVSDPTNNNAAYNLVTSQCTGSGATLTCSSSTQFGNLRFYLAYGNMVGQSTSVTDFSSYNNGGSGANAYAYKGTNDGSNHYSVDIALPADVAGLQVAFGTARVVSIGQIKEPKLEVKSATDPRPVAVPASQVNVIVQNAFKEVALTGTLQPRRTIVATEKCNTCHGALGTTSGSNTLSEAFHSGARDIVEACVVCHDANRSSSGNMMTNGLNLYEPFQFKRMIHGIHGNSKRTSPFAHGNKVVGVFNMDGTSASGGASLAAGGAENYAAEVAWPGVGINCNVCHVNNSYKQDLSPLGAVVQKPITSAAGVTPVVYEADPNKWLVISPKAATCTACHDSSKAIGHVTSFGGASFGNKTQGQIAALPRETCDDCHASGLFKGVDIVHGQK